MSTLFTRDAGLIFLILACAVLGIMPVQFGLCFWAKKRFMKCLPVIILAVATITLYIMAITARTWIAFMYLIIAAFTGFSLVFCGVAWVIWSVVKLIKRKTAIKRI